MTPQKALFNAKCEFEKRKRLHFAATGEKPFNIEELRDFLEEHFIGQVIGCGVGGFLPFVEIELDKALVMRNRYAIDAAGQYKRLNNSEELQVLKDLCANPSKIGIKATITSEEYWANQAHIETPQELIARQQEEHLARKNAPINDEMIEAIEQVLKKGIQNER